MSELLKAVPFSCGAQSIVCSRAPFPAKETQIKRDHVLLHGDCYRTLCMKSAFCERVSGGCRKILIRCVQTGSTRECESVGGMESIPAFLYRKLATPIFTYHDALRSWSHGHR